MMKNWFVLVIIFGLLLHNPLLAQNKLDKSKKELNQGSSKEVNRRNSSSNSTTKEVTIENPFLQIAGYIFFGAFKYGLIGDYKNEDHLYGNLTPYPYYNGTSGNFKNYETDTIKKNEFRIDLENYFIYNDNDLFGNHLKAKIRPFQYFQIQSDFHQLYEFEKIDNNTTTYRLSLFHFNLGYDRIRLEKFNLGWTLGASYVGNEVRKGGFSYGVQADYFMNTRISFSAAAKWSTINQQPVHVYEFQSKFHRKNYFFSLGFEHLKIATPTYSLLSLGGGIYF
jgi:hypothetical protein